MAAHLPVIDLPVDRTRALVRGLWRLLCAVLAAGLAFLIHVDWRLLWLAQPASFVGLGVIWLTLVCTGLALGTSAVRWLLLAVWPAELGARITPHDVRLRLGPFGSSVHRWQDIAIQIEDGLDPGLLDGLPDDAFVPVLRSSVTNEDLAATILLYSPLGAEQLTRRLRPYVSAFLSRADR